MQKKKLMGAALALALLVPYGPAQAADVLKNLKLDGSIDVQATSANNISDFNTSTYDQIGDAQARVMVNTGWDLLDDVHSMVSFGKNDFSWGASGGNGVHTPGGTGSASQPIMAGAGNGVLNQVFLDQAYIKVDKVLGAVDATLGRQFYGNAGDMVIYFGPYQNLYGLGTSAIDAARFDWSNDMFGVTGLAGKFKSVGPLTGATSEGGAAGAGSVDIQGVNLTAKGNDMWNAGGYVWEKQTHNTASGANPAVQGNDYLWVVGLKAKAMAGPAWIKGEVAKNFGYNRVAAAPHLSGNYDGWAFKLDAGAKADIGAATIEPWGQFADGSGGSGTTATSNQNRNFVAINPDYRPGGIYGYFSSIATGGGLGATSGLGTVSSNSLGDRVVWGLGLKATPAGVNKLTAGISYWDYRFQSLAGTPAAAKGAKHIGSEADLNLTWKHSDNVSFNVAVGQFWVGGAIQNSQPGTDPATLYQFNTSVKF